MVERKQKYEKPAMQVFKLKQKPTLLAGSGEAGVQNYDWNDESPE